MEKRYVYAGNETVGTWVATCLEEAGYERTLDVASAALVVTYFTSQTTLEDAYFDAEGLVQAAHPNTVLLDLSASTPNFARELNAIALVSDLIAIEAPIVVSKIMQPGVFEIKENLMCFVAADEQMSEEVRAVLGLLVGNVEETGAPGSAQLARAAYTLQFSAQIMAAIEADALCRATQRSSASFGADFSRAGAIAPEAEQVLAAVNRGCFEGAYSVEMLMAELSAALMAADDVDLILPQAEACLHLLELLAVIGGADKAPSALALVYGEEAACAENGLDWTRAEQAYASEEDDGYSYDDEEDQDDYPAGFNYSAN